jgi:hypothetical protein
LHPVRVQGTPHAASAVLRQHLNVQPGVVQIVQQRILGFDQADRSAIEVREGELDSFVTTVEVDQGVEPLSGGLRHVGRVNRGGFDRVCLIDGGRVGRIERGDGDVHAVEGAGEGAAARAIYRERLPASPLGAPPANCRERPASTAKTLVGRALAQRLRRRRSLGNPG